ncbi:uncharacterized protein LOC134212398 [Armigeres subalbatus]|uniref:uncharacterized protein LOC134212398 n=1 Tax=Armigeres subalbatus TaxID=124917 RepID=UPI002ED610C8
MDRRAQRHHYMRNEYRGKKYVRKSKQKNVNHIIRTKFGPRDYSNYSEVSDVSSMKETDYSSESDFDGFDTSIDDKQADRINCLDQYILNAEGHVLSNNVNSSLVRIITDVITNEMETQRPINDSNDEDVSMPEEKVPRIDENANDTETISSLEPTEFNDFQSENSFNATKNPLKFMPGLETSDALFIILNFYIRHRLTQEALVDLLKLLNIITGVKNFPENFETFSNAFPDPYDTFRVYFCANCQCEVGSQAPPKGIICSVPGCNSMNFDFFVVLPIEKQLQETVRKYKVEIEEYEQSVHEENIPS